MDGRSRQQPIRRGFQLLLDAYYYAQDCEADLWDFALEIKLLRAVGLTENEFRWLTRKGYVEHSLDATLSGDDHRTFRPAPTHRFVEKSCFVLTARGVEAASSVDCEAHDRIIKDGEHEEDPCRDACAKAKSTDEASSPFWDGERHELWMGNDLVKQFKRHARNQEAILAVFQEEGWPPRIDDPLPPAPEVDAKRRLNDTIKSLNRHQKTPLVRFMGNGTGEGVVWEMVDANGRSIPPRPPVNGHPNGSSRSRE